MLASRGSALWTPAGVLCSVALSGAGVLTQTRGLKDGNSVVVCTCAAVSSMASGRLLMRPTVRQGAGLDWLLSGTTTVLIGCYEVGCSPGCAPVT